VLYRTKIKKKKKKEEKKIKKDEKKINKEKEEIKKEEKEDKKEDKKENKIEDKKQIKEDKKIETKKENKKENKKEDKKEKEESKKKSEKNQKPKNVNKPISKTNEQKKDIDPKTIPKKEENKKEIKNNQTAFVSKEKPKLKFQKKPKASNKNKICHFFLKKGTDIDIKEYDYFMVKKIKKGKSMLSKLNNLGNNLGINLNLNIKFGGINKVGNKINSFFKKKTKDIKYTDYYLILNEQFIYFCKDAEIFTDEPDKRRIGSIVPINNITKIEVDRDGELYKISFEIQFRTENKIKEIYIEKDIYEELLEIFHEFKKDYNLEYNIEIKQKN
jgi:hypothetical protein